MRLCVQCGKRVLSMTAPHKPRTKSGPVPNTDWYCSLGCKWTDEEVSE